MQQEQALQLLKMGENIFLTGAAGAGKTYVLNQYVTYLKDHLVRVAMTASTGIAATHLNGMTIHAWSGIGIKDELTRKDLEKLLKNDRIRRNYQKTKVLIIDEISMLHKHQLDMVDEAARYVLQNDKPFGGMQVVLCGDFFQLPPVTSGGASKEIAFAYEADVWASAAFKVCYLQEQHRQKDDPLLTVLNDIRHGRAGEHTKVPLRTRYKKEPQGSTKPTKLYSRNINVDTINNRELASLPGEEKVFEMTADGFSARVESLKKSCLALEVLKLKIGAEVMFIKNDVQGRFVNGTRCIVVGFEKQAGWPIVKTYHDEIIVASPEAWQQEDNGVVKATITQVPLRLAWAITIHKSQGMTLDAAEMDLGDTFEPGMGYVALSRVRSLNGLKLMNLNNMALTVHPKILQQDISFKESSNKAVNSLNAIPMPDIIRHQQQVMNKRFGGSKTKVIVQKVKTTKKEKSPTHMVTLDLLKKGSSLKDIAKSRELTMTTIIGHIEKLHGLQMLDESLKEQLKQSVPEDQFDEIFDAVNESADGRLKSIYNQLGGRCGYHYIRIVRLLV